MSLTPDIPYRELEESIELSHVAHPESGSWRSTSRVRIIEQALDGLPDGPYITPDRKYALPPRHELATSMEALIHHFKLVTEGLPRPARARS